MLVPDASVKAVLDWYIPQGLKPHLFVRTYGTAEAVPFQSGAGISNWGTALMLWPYAAERYNRAAVPNERGEVMEKVGGMRAIVVDDSTAMRAVLRLILKQHGFEVMEAKNGKDGLHVLEESGPVQLALIDWNMPEMGGLELLQGIRENHAFDAMRVMMVTTETDLLQVRKALVSGADEYVMKPFNREIIADKLNLLGF
jgi:two-component system chemotaxis response regulator CheY